MLQIDIDGFRELEFIRSDRSEHVDSADGLSDILTNQLIDRK